jgi:isopenicillin N synthase-like dioxygenase
MNRIPLIDVSASLEGATQTDKNKLAQKLVSCYSELGFAQIINHGISPDLIAAIFEQSRLFHALPLEDKLPISLNRTFRGYLPREGSTLRVSSLEKSVTQNLSESFILMNEYDTNHPDYLREINVAGPNQWPSVEKLPQFKNILCEYRKEATKLVYRLLQLFCWELWGDYHALDKYLDNPTTLLRLQYYPQHEPIDGNYRYGISPHTDYGFLTLLLQDSVGGLEVRSPDKLSWIPVEPISGAIVLNTSDILSRLSGNRILSTPHRATNRSSCADRYSIPFFYEPDTDSMIPCVDDEKQMTSEKKPYSVYLMERIKANYNIGAREASDLILT